MIPATRKPRRVLIVDDNPAIHDDFRKILVRNEDQSLADLAMELFSETRENATAAAATTFEMDSASQGEEALRMVIAALESGTPYAMAFIDMRMPPGWDGVETITKIWEVDPNLEVVICTAYSDYSWEAILEKLGTSDRVLLLKKPFDTAEVCQLACALTEKWHLARHAHLKLSQLRSMVEEQTRDLEQTNRRLQESETRYALAAAGANDGLWDWNIAENVIYYSPRWKEMLGFGPSEVPSTIEAWFDRIHEGDRERVVQMFKDHRRGPSSHHSIEYRIKHKDGQYRWMLCRGLAVRDSNGEMCRAAGSQTDITDRKVAEAQLRHDAFHDALTGLPNRALLSERLGRCIARQRRQQAFRFAVMFVDLDHFKVINDSLGHLVGDRLLVALAKRLSACIRETDTLALSEGHDLVRMGGDEFVVLLEGIRGDEDAFRIADRLLESASQPFVIDGNEVHVSLSIGIAIGKPAYHRAEEVLRDADSALYRAKSDGRGRHAVFSDELHTSAMLRWQMENDLRRALERRELFLQYQPVVSLETGEVTQFEALVRWRHATRGVISPMDFIPLAEETGLIIPLGAWVLEQACNQVREWRSLLADAGAPSEISVAVNVSNKQFVQPSFVDDVKSALAAAKIPARALKIEVTESTTMATSAIETCARLGELGIKLHLDDFGTGYSSLSYLHRMTLNALKIDRAFIRAMCGESMNASIVEAILALSRSLGLEAIAEGVETEAELEFLRAMGCRSGQGYHWSKPVDPADAFEILCGQPFRSAPSTATRTPPAPSARPEVTISAPPSKSSFAPL